MKRSKPDWVSQADWDDVDSPELSADEIAEMRPMAEVLPDIVESFRRARGPQKAPTKQLVSLRLDKDVIDHFRAGGEGWQSRINAALRKASGL
jgi:uncharacterized protein (DUF4415 family)